MFIDVGSPVDVVAGPYSGRFGVVVKMRIFHDVSRRLVDLLVFCELFNYETGLFDFVTVEHSGLVRRKLSPGQAEALALDAVGGKYAQA